MVVNGRKYLWKQGSDPTSDCSEYFRGEDPEKYWIDLHLRPGNILDTTVSLNSLVLPGILPAAQTVN